VADQGGKAERGLFFPGWTVVALCFLSLNFSVGIVFAAFGPLVKSISAEFGASRALASVVLSAASLVMGLLAPSVGRSLQKFSARNMMLGGCSLVALGYVLAAYVSNIYALYAIYGLLIGAGFIAMGIVTCSTLVTRWFNEKRGLALGIINLFPGMAIFPALVTYVVDQHGLATAFLMNAALMGCLVPLFLLIKDYPAKMGLSPLGGEPEAAATQQTAQFGDAPTGLLGRPAFWLLSLGIALLTGVANVLTVHYTPMLQDAKVPEGDIRTVQVVYGAMLALCAPFYGAVIDRLGPFRMLLVGALIMLAGWIGIAVSPVTFVTFLLLLSVVALSNGGIVTLHTSSAAKLFSPAEFSRSMGLGYFVKMPLMLAGPPLAGYVYDQTGSYEIAIISGVLIIAVALALFAILYAGHRSSIRQPLSA
jgi:MFS family permease